MGLSSRKTFTIFLLVPSVSLLYAFQLPNTETFSKWNHLLELKLYDLVASATQLDFARNVYKSDNFIKINKINGEEILKVILKKLGTLLASKKSALRKLVDKAEEKFTNFQKMNRSMLNLDDLSFFNMKAVESTATLRRKMEFNSRFRQFISFDESGVHIPLEIYDGWMGPRYKEAWWHDSEILNGLNWTAGLDEVFKENLKSDPQLRWQYFGSFYGFMRVYPAFRWPDHPSLPDLFDVRRRSWYIQGSVTPKDVIILIDRSGSVHGPTLDIMKITARALLNSLGENDYVNVAWFNNKVKWVIPCINTLVQATAQMRRLLGDAVEQLTESNLTSYTTALDFAFQEFKKFDESKKPWAGSDCHKIVMFLSDGGTEWPTDLISRHCNESRNGRIKIFTFACGPHPIPTVVLKEMACSTGGYFSPVTALGSVRVKIRDYIKVLSRPLAYSHDEELYRWHNFYRDVGGLGMVTTVTLPVLNKTPKNKKIVNLLGIMGIDVPVEEMTALFPKYLMGSFGYPFAINTNGFVVFHPRLHDHIVYLEDPPNIYLTDLEGDETKIKEMEKAIIDGRNGTLKNFQSIVPIGLGHAILMDMDYYYGAVKSTTFRFGIALPSNHTNVKIENLDVNEHMSFLRSIKGVLLAPWKFCEETDTDEDLTVEKLLHQISNGNSSCDEDLISHLLWDAKRVFQISSHWNNDLEFGSGSGIHSKFLITSSGLTIAQAASEREGYMRQLDPMKNNLYKRASLAQGFIFSLSKETRNKVTAAAGITVNNSYVAAVIGTDIEQQMIQEVFEEVLNIDSNVSCVSSEFMHCYLLNDGGIVAASNVKTSKPGDFIGIHDPELLEVLVSEGVLKREYRYNYQSWCSRESQQVQAKAAPLPFSIVKFAFEAAITFNWNFLYTCLLYLVSSISAWKKSDHTDQVLENVNHSCVTRSAWYYHSKEPSTNLQASLNCGPETRDLRISFLPKVKLLFLVTQPPCNYSQYFRAVTLDQDEDVEFHHCQVGQHYRLRPDKCYSHMPKGISSDCGATSNGQIFSLPETILCIEALLILVMQFIIIFR